MRLLVTGTAGFIGFHLARALLEAGHAVHGFDGITPYYDPRLKAARHAILAAMPGFTATEARLETPGALAAAAAGFRPEVIVHLAAQAGVRHSLTDPRAYLESNLAGTMPVLEVAAAQRVRHLLLASTSSVYGANGRLPFRETDTADTPLSFYAATKKAMEALSHAWSHQHALPVTCFRFFTVYGSWARPDLALSRFAEAILGGRPVEVYGEGRMARDFTHVSDIVRAIRALIDTVPGESGRVEGDSLSPAAPWRVVNIGSGAPVPLPAYIDAIERALGRRAERRLLPLQPGDLRETWADTALLQRLTGFVPATPLDAGIAEFAAWFRDWRGRYSPDASSAARPAR